MNWEVVNDIDQAKIKVIGVGGAGGNAVIHMMNHKIQGVEFICANTDSQALENAKGATILKLGGGMTKGLGAGANPEVGRQAAERDREAIEQLLHGSDMIFITAGMGGGTGTGAAPVIASIAKELGALTVAVVTKPFKFEGKPRMSSAEKGLAALVEEVDSLITIPNQKLIDVLGANTPIPEAFAQADDVLKGAVQGISDIIMKPGLINVDYADVKTTGGDLPDVTVDPDSDACIFYTSGTTGRPKGAQLTHRGCVHNIMNVAAMGQIFATTQALGRGESVDAPVSAPPATSLVATPLFHVTANNCVMHGATLSGGKLVLMYKWDTEEALKLIEREQVNTLSAVPMMTRELLAHPDFADYDTSSLASLGGGGAAMHPDLPNKVIESTQRAKPAQGYGMTEVCGISTYTAGDLFLARPESCGPLVPTLEGKVINEAGETLPVGEAGELLVKGAPVIKGYLNRPEATAETIVEGWLHTGDIGYFDEDGFLYLVDRAKDMILRGGENIYCAEVEGALYTHPAVLETVAFAVPDDRLGEEVGVAVHLKPDAMLDAPGLREHMSSRLAAFKVPRYVWFLSEPLPRNANGKFLKRELREVLDPASAD